MCSSNSHRFFTACQRSARCWRSAPARWLGLIAFSIAACAPVTADSQRRTTDWRADLIAVLMDRQMTDTAVAICQRHVSKAEPRSEAAARWSIRWSAALASKMLGSESVSEEDVNAAKQPVADLLRAYDQHERRLWLRTQLAMVDFAAAQQAAVAYAIASHRDDLQSLGLERISRSLRQFDEIEQSLQSELSRVASARVTDGAGEPTVTSAELIALQQNVGKQRVTGYLLRSHLFPERSEDAIASATQAVAAADAVLARMQSNASFRPQVILLKAEAMYRSGHPAQAEQLLDVLQESLAGELPPEGLALQVRIATEQSPAKAAEMLSSYYGSDPAAAPVSTAMDLARLRWMLEMRNPQEPESEDEVTAQVANWLEAIERRGGAYARRRAEAEALQRMRVAPGSSDAPLLAAEAAKRLREGEANAAADLLVQAADSAPEPEQSLKYAQQAAAVFLRVHEHGRASEILLRTARRHASEPVAAKAHLQAALLISKKLQESSGADLEPLVELLKEHVTRWPRHSTTEKAKPWLLSILRVTGRHAEAARFVMSQDVLSAEDIRSAGDFWRSGLRALDDPQEQQRTVDEAISLFADSQSPTPEVREIADWQAVWTASLFGTREQLRGVRTGAMEPSEKADPAVERFRFVRSLVQFRLKGRPAAALETEELTAHRPTIVDAIHRLRADGEDHPGDRRRLGAAMLRLLEASQASEGTDTGGRELSVDPLVEPLARGWAGQWKEAASQISSVVENASSKERAELMQQAATILGDSDSADAQREAVSYWNRLAQGLPQGSPRWHQAKLAVARLLVGLGETNEAKQICRFVLITRPPKDPAVRAEYETILQR